MHEYEYQVPPQALWEWDDGQSMYPPNTNEPMVIYRALYGQGETWTRPASMWNEQVTLPDGQAVPRFRREEESGRNNE